MTINPARVVADADVLAADLLIDGPDRTALDLLWTHSWTTLIASPALIADAEAVIATLTTDEIAQDWRTRITDWVEFVDHPPQDHPALAAAVRGNAAHLLTNDPTLTTAETAAKLQRVETSPKPPTAFVRGFDPKTIYETTHDDSYPGPDRDPRH